VFNIFSKNIASCCVDGFKTEFLCATFVYNWNICTETGSVSLNSLRSSLRVTCVVSGAQFRSEMDPRWAIGAIAPPKTYENNFFHHEFVQFGKHHSLHKATLSSSVLSQQCCRVYFISLTVLSPQ